MYYLISVQDTESAESLSPHGPQNCILLKLIGLLRNWAGNIPYLSPIESPFTFVLITCKRRMLSSGTAFMQRGKTMDLESILDPRRRGYGTTCRNCVHLACEYDLDNCGNGQWVCNKGRNFKEDFLPHSQKMDCFEPCFWFTVFAPDFNAAEEAIEDAFSRFSKEIRSTRI